MPRRRQSGNSANKLSSKKPLVPARTCQTSQYSLQMQEAPEEWERIKSRPIKHYTLPIHYAAGYSAQKPFVAINAMFDKQNAENGATSGAIHIRFDDDVKKKVTLTKDDLTEFYDVRNIKWTQPDKNVGVFIDENYTDKRSKKNVALDFLHQTRTSSEPKLSENSTLEDLDEYIMTCTTREYSVGTDGGITPTEKLNNFHPFNVVALEDFLLYSQDFESLHGITTPWIISGDAKTVTAMHLEDKKLASINAMVCSGLKIWIIIQSNITNVRRFVTKAAESIMAITNQPYCKGWHLQKKYGFTIKQLINWDVKFNIALQTGVDIIVTESLEFHQIVNVLPNVTVARNLMYNRTTRVFNTFLQTCHKECKRHMPLKLDISSHDFDQWLLKDAKQRKKFVGRTTAFRINNVKWGLKEKSVRMKKDLATSFQIHRGPEIVRIGARNCPGGEFSLVVIVSKKNLVSSEIIMQQLKGVVTPKSPTKPAEVFPCVGQDLMEQLRTVPILNGDIIEIAEENGLTWEKLGMIESFLPLHGIGGVIHKLGPAVKRRAFPVCEICRCPNMPDHERGKQHRKTLQVVS